MTPLGESGVAVELEIVSGSFSRDIRQQGLLAYFYGLENVLRRLQDQGEVIIEIPDGPDVILRASLRWVVSEETDLARAELPQSIGA